MRPSNYVSNIKWLFKTFKPLIGSVENWHLVFLFYLLPRSHRNTLTIELRNGTRLRVPGDYIFQPVAETLLQNAYQFRRGYSRVVVDVGASVGDFALLASATPNVRVYAFEPDRGTFRYMKENVSSNDRNVEVFNRPATSRELKQILDRESNIDFLKVDCEGCEYELLLGSPIEVLSRIKAISMEIHSSKGHTKDEIVSRLRAAGFGVSQRRRIGEGHYVYAFRPGSLRPSPPQIAKCG